MAQAHRPNGTRFWHNGLPLGELPFQRTQDTGAQKFWFRGVPTGGLWVGLRAAPDVRWLYPPGPRRETGPVRYWLDGVSFDGLQKGTDTPEGFEKFWVNGRPDVGLFPPPPEPGPMPALFIAP